MIGFPQTWINDRQKSEPDINNSVPPNKIIGNIKNFYHICMKNKYIKII